MALPTKVMRRAQRGPSPKSRMARRPSGVRMRLPGCGSARGGEGSRLTDHISSPRQQVGTSPHGGRHQGCLQRARVAAGRTRGTGKKTEEVGGG